MTGLSNLKSLPLTIVTTQDRSRKGFQLALPRRSALTLRPSIRPSPKLTMTPL